MTSTDINEFFILFINVFLYLLQILNFVLGKLLQIRSLQHLWGKQQLCEKAGYCGIRQVKCISIPSNIYLNIKTALHA